MDTLVRVAPPNIPYPGHRPAERWQVAKDLELRVKLVTFVGFADSITLEVRYDTECEDPNGEEAAEERRLLFEYITATFPEYREAFSGVHIGSVDSLGRGQRDYFPFE